MTSSQDSLPGASGASSHLLATLSVVIIGRNEGPRLGRCLDSVRAMQAWPGPVEMIYVDSGSTDNSLAVAEAAGAHVIALQPERPTAALGRNAGWRAASGEYILFLDGDTVLHPEFAAAALAELRQHAEVAAVCGHRREMHPNQSIYTRVFDLDWIFPLGEDIFFGGDVLIRRAALEAAGGYDPALIAGEEPELCGRLRAAGWKILRIDHPMTGHDLAMTRWREYWRRGERTGHAAAEVSRRFRGTADGLWAGAVRATAKRALFWMLSPLAALALSLVLRSAWPLALWLLLALALVARTAWKYRWKTRSPYTLALYAVHSHLQQIPIFMGQVRFWFDARRGRQRGLIEYHR
ncbi:MAG TPA: glycosyltransferase family 2 protein [Acidobacterium sp.]|uniref:Glycosyl transferase, group 2 family n=1 Tax=Acidobacterium capsulatum (strain ATCC 51196 / DSM 11244 / BCRC 80197 / JCM 7670 / NBRC 15755 / NCIMB 13165 / 161) TaxID=240015 RepID=C1F6E2_ACIC5|nr:glycosyl transferase, group 2 family [Acidobacterium capsulatum ATCC 51196]HCT60733.1 glycosyltransferase family 2 protein [Acidobacterium sp.]